MKILITLALCFSSLLHFANGGPAVKTSVLSGTVLESGSDASLTGVRVSIAGTDIFTYTDKEGNFTFQDVPVGNVELVFSLVSFQKRSFTLATIPGSNSPIEIDLIAR